MYILDWDKLHSRLQEQVDMTFWQPKMDRRPVKLDPDKIQVAEAKYKP